MLRIFRQIGMLTAREHPLRVPQRLDQRNDLHEPLPAAVSKRRQLLDRGALRALQLRMALPARVLHLQHHPVHLVARDHPVDQLEPERGIGPARKQVRTPERKAGPVGHAAG